MSIDQTYQTMEAEIGLEFGASGIVEVDRRDIKSTFYVGAASVLHTLQGLQPEQVGPMIELMSNEIHKYFEEIR